MHEIRPLPARQLEKQVNACRTLVLSITPEDAAASGIKLEAAVARERAKLFNDVYTTTLDVMHHRYFRQDGPVLPTRAMENVFEEMAGLSGNKANWISVNTKAMSTNHEPGTVFEKKAAAELSGGKEEYELVGNGVYQRAVAIPLRARCVGCHQNVLGAPQVTALCRAGDQHPPQAGEKVTWSLLPRA